MSETIVITRTNCPICGCGCLYSIYSVTVETARYDEVSGQYVPTGELVSGYMEDGADFTVSLESWIGLNTIHIDYDDNHEPILPNTIGYLRDITQPPYGCYESPYERFAVFATLSTWWERFSFVG